MESMQECSTDTPEITSGVTFLNRGWARIIDLVYKFCIGLAAQFSTGFILGLYCLIAEKDINPIIQKIDRFSFPSFIIILSGAIIFQSLMEGLHGASPGKMITGMRVVNADGKPGTFFQALKREIAFLVDSLFFGLVAYSYMNGDPLNRRLGDKWAGTIVVKKDQLKPVNIHSLGIFILVFIGSTFILGIVHTLAVLLKIII